MKRKYPTLWGCYVDEGYEKSYTYKYLQALVNVHHYKGHMLLRVLPAPPKKGEKHQCNCPSIQYPFAWLDGDDLDAVIKLLRDAKKVWLKAYNKAKREVFKRDATKKRGQSRLKALRKSKKLRAEARKRSRRSPRMTAGGTDFSYD